MSRGATKTMASKAIPARIIERFVGLIQVPQSLQTFVHQMHAHEFHERPGEKRNPKQHEYQHRGSADPLWNTGPQQRTPKVTPNESRSGDERQEWQSAEQVNLGMRNHCRDREGHCGRKQRQDGDEKQQPAHVHSFLGIRREWPMAFHGSAKAAVRQATQLRRSDRRRRQLLIAGTLGRHQRMHSMPLPAPSGIGTLMDRSRNRVLRRG